MFNCLQGSIALPYRVPSGEWQDLLSRSDVKQLLLVRHPHTRLLSGYLDQVVGKRAAGRFPAGYDPYVGGSALPAGGFDAFVRAVVGAKELGDHFKLQGEQCGVNLGMEYRYLKVEDMNEWYDEIICMLSLQDAAGSGWQEPFLPYHGDSPCFHSRPTSGCASNCSRPGRQLRVVMPTHANDKLEEYYTEALAELVNSWAQADLQTFGYEPLKLRSHPMRIASEIPHAGKLPQASYRAPQIDNRELCDPDPPIGWLTQFALNRKGVRINNTQPIRNAVLEACAPLHEAKVVLWVGGPPGVGKSTLVQEVRRYGFSSMDSELDWTFWDGRPGDHLSHGNRVTPIGGLASLLRMKSPENRTKRRLMTFPNPSPSALKALSRRFGQLKIASEWALRETTSAFIFGVCFGEWVAKTTPSEVVGVLLLPDHSTYENRWQTRNADDRQGNEQRWQADLAEWTALERKVEMQPKLWVRLMDTNESCPAASIATMCRQVMLGLVSQPMNPSSYAFTVSVHPQHPSLHRTAARSVGRQYRSLGQPYACACTCTCTCTCACTCVP